MKTEKTMGMDLQLMAQGAHEPAAAQQNTAPVETKTAADGQQRLRELGVPEEKLAKRAKKQGCAAKTAPETQAAAENTASDSDNTRRMTWDEIMADPEYNAEMQAIVRKRLGQSKAAQAAADAGANQPAQTARPIRTHGDSIQRHFADLHRQAQALKESAPDFDLGQALRDPAFARLVAPGSPVSLKAAFYATHPDMAIGTDRTARTQADGLPRRAQVQTARPVENGALPQAASVMTADVRNKAYRDQIKQQMRRAAAQGQKLYPTSGRR